MVSIMYLALQLLATLYSIFMYFDVPFIYYYKIWKFCMFLCYINSFVAYNCLINVILCMSFGKNIEFSFMQDIWCHIHSLMPMREAAQVACVSQAFVRSWRCHPNLHFSKETLGLNKNTCQKDGISDFFLKGRQKICRNFYQTRKAKKHRTRKNNCSLSWGQRKNQNMTADP